ncbi:MAG: oxygen-independent coproporphyrinogen-3 oxidase [Spirosomataceae bacterium]|jgi:oxygen-independent coproporphyrinogen-3 oxidase
MITADLIEKYNVAGPRYTSYPTVPHWKPEKFTLYDWKSSIRQRTTDSKGISLYIHLPFCESLCTFCACHKRITKNHALERPYINSVLNEWQMYANILPADAEIEEIHLGGGSPSFFDDENLQYLIDGIMRYFPVAKDHEFSWEGNPVNTTYAQLKTLYDVGFRRVSFGVQDYDINVQRAIHREQSFETVETATQAARSIGYTSVNHDLVFGLPFQTFDSVKSTIEKTLKLAPDRLAFYSYAHVPWLKGNGQRGYDEANLPTGHEKHSFYEIGKKMLQQAGYSELGMDHFALPEDTLFKVAEEGNMRRNFMGYTTTQNNTLIGLGASAISDAGSMYAQNVKNVEEYQMLINGGNLPILKGHKSTEKELFVRQIIADIMCNGEAEWQNGKISEYTKNQLEELELDGLIKLGENSLEVTELGHSYLRNICMYFDECLIGNKSENMFSKTV